jgi:hypothetical protein
MEDRQPRSGQAQCHAGQQNKWGLSSVIGRDMSQILMGRIRTREPFEMTVGEVGRRGGGVSPCSASDRHSAASMYACGVG